MISSPFVILIRYVLAPFPGRVPLGTYPSGVRWGAACAADCGAPAIAAGTVSLRFTAPPPFTRCDAVQYDRIFTFVSRTPKPLGTSADCDARVRSTEENQRTDEPVRPLPQPRAKGDCTGIESDRCRRESG